VGSKQKEKKNKEKIVLDFSKGRVFKSRPFVSNRLHKQSDGGMRKLGNGFFKENTVKTAKSLLGKYLVTNKGGKKTAGMIVETEAYRGKDDPGSHAFRKKTDRNALMFGRPGKAYVYFCYGCHYLFNIVTEPEGEAGAVLIRAIEPSTGIDIMMARRKTFDINNVSNGPGKLTEALGIGRKDNGKGLAGSEIYAAAGPVKRFKTASGPRIGIKTGLDKKWRFWIKGSRFISVKERNCKKRGR